MPKIGIFWVYAGEVFGRAVDLSAAEERAPGYLDSPDDHADLWENHLGLLRPFPTLRDEEYHKVPRGRVIWQKKQQVATVYMDTTLFDAKTKSDIVAFFNLEDAHVCWKTDPHYTTDRKQLARLFDDEEDF